MQRLVLPILVLSLALATLSLGAPARAGAQSAALDPGRGGMDLHLYRPAMDSRGFLSVNGTDVLGHLDFALGLVVDGGFGLLPYDGFVNADDRGTSSLSDPAVRCGRDLLCGRAVDYVMTGTLQANLGLFNLLEAGVQIPVAFAAGGNITIPGLYDESATPSGLSYQGFGGIVIHTKVRLVRAERSSGFGLAAALQVELPSGSPAHFVGDTGTVFWPMLAAEWRPDRLVRFGAQLGARLWPGDTPTVPVGGHTTISGSGAATCALSDGNPVTCGVAGGTSVAYGPHLTYGLAGGVRLGDSPIELVVDVYGASLFGALGVPGGTSLEAIGGLRLFVDRNSYLALSGGGALPIGGLLSADVRGMLAFVLEPSIGDRDGDGYRDDDDECPSEPEDFDDFDDANGCPDPDDDRDGILDVDDACRMVPEDRDGDADQDGCPEGGVGDRDGDGILDLDDGCPDEPEDHDGWQDEDGCPDDDNDRDGTLDVDDLCPNDPEDPDGWQDPDGCPDPDNDDDRILDVDDDCPNDPESYNGTEDDDGCPDHGILDVGTGGITLFEPIQFAYDSAEILPESFHILDAIAATLIAVPQIELVEIQGHADDRGNDEYNLDLTRDRAAAVVDGLVARGVAAVRMRSMGYGERCPVEPGTSIHARDANRRVEIVILRNGGASTGVRAPCAAGASLFADD